MTPGGSPIFFRAPVDAIFQRIMAEDYDVERKGRHTFVKCGGLCILLERERRLAVSLRPSSRRESNTSRARTSV